MSEIITVRDVEIITSEIRTIEETVAKVAIYASIEIGRRLTEVKEIVGHGGWGRYLEENLNRSQQWATNMMNLYKEYGGGQASLFESFANSKSFGNIDVTKHILLLAVPPEERAAFAQANDAENSTVRELEEAIREREAAEERLHRETARAERAEEKAAQMGLRAGDAEARLKASEALMEAKDADVKAAQGEAKAAGLRAAEAADEAEKLKIQLKKAKDAEKEAKSALAQAREKPEIPEAMMEEMRSAVAAEAAEKATEELKKQLEAAQAAADEARKRAMEAQEKVEAAEKAARLQDPNMVLVSTYLQGVQEQFNKMVGALKKVKLSDPETGEKLKANVKGKLLESLSRALESV